MNTIQTLNRFEQMRDNWPGGQEVFDYRFLGGAMAIMTDEQLKYVMETIETFRQQDSAEFATKGSI